MEPLIQSSFISGLEPLLREKGVQPISFYRQAHLPTAVIGHPYGKISFFRELRLLEMASHYFGQPDFCLSLTERQSVNAFGAAIDPLPAGSTLRDALQQLSSRLYLSIDDTHLELEEAGGVMLLKLYCTDEHLMNNVYLQNHGLALIRMFLMQLCGPQLRLRAVHFRHHDQRNSVEFYRYFNAPLAYGSSWAGIALDAAYLRHSILPLTLKPDETLSGAFPDTLLAHPQNPTTSGSATNGTAGKVMETIASLLRGGDCHIEGAAQRLGLSKRTLQRRLFEEQRSFQDLVDDVRKKQATILLQSPNHRLIDVAEVLGYTNSSAFSRSFKRWYGISPQEWQKRQT